MNYLEILGYACVYFLWISAFIFAFSGGKYFKIPFYFWCVMVIVALIGAFL